MLSKVIVKKDNEIMASYEGTYRSMYHTFYEWIDFFNLNEKRLKCTYLIEWFNENEELVRSESYLK